MSGPYDCLMCGGSGDVEVMTDDADDFKTECCRTCNGTGERWLGCVFSPSQEDREAGRVEYIKNVGWRFKEGCRPPYLGKVAPR